MEEVWLLRPLHPDLLEERETAANHDLHEGEPFGNMAIAGHMMTEYVITNG